MNWTGGHLKRHSKANANHQLKSQKQYFAKARQKLQNGPVTAPPSTFSLFSGQFTAGRHDDLRRTPPDSRHLSKSLNNASRRHASLSGRESPVNAPTSGNEDGRVCGLATRQSNAPVKVQKAPEKLNALDHIKRRLLQNSDWTGLALARPVSMKFTPAEEMERIGRRREVTKEERRRKAHRSGQQKVHHNLIRPFDNRGSQSTVPVPEATDLSIRIGSNIHQTLTTQPSLQEQPKSSLYHSTTGESMLLYKLEHQIGDARNKGPEALYLAAEAESVHDPERPNLVPLDEARDLTSFDEVLQRSSSMVRQVLPSSTPFSDGRPHQRTPVRAPHRGTSRVSSFGSSFHPEDVIPLLEKAKHSSLDTRYAHNGAEEQGQLDNLRRIESGPPILGAGQSESHPRTAASRYDDRPSTSKSQSESRNFTLDRQVALERESFEQSRGYPSKVNALASTVEKLEIPNHSPKSASQITNRTPLPTNRFLAYPGGGALHFSSIPASFASSLGSASPQLPDRGTAQPSEGSMQALPGPIHTSSRPSALPRGVQTQPRGAKSWMEKSQLAKEQHQASTSSNNMDVEKPESRTGRLGDENEAWMKFVFPKDFGRIQTDFTFGLRPSGKEGPKATTISSWDYETKSLSAPGHDLAGNSSARADVSAPPSGVSAATAANATIFDPSWNQKVSRDDLLPRSETDFLSRFSPMEGVLDEGLGDISIYNNAAATDRSFVSIPQSRIRQDTMRRQHLPALARHVIPAKRAAIYAFDEPGEPTPSFEQKRSKIRPVALSPPLQRSSELSGFLERSHRTPLKAIGQVNTQTDPRGPHSPRTGLSRHREAVFPMGYSPASSDKPKPSQHPRSNSQLFRPPSRSSLGIAQNYSSSHPSLADSHSLWQVSPGEGAGTGSSESGSHLRGPALRTPLFGNDGRLLEVTPAMNALPYTRPAISQHRQV